MDRTGIRMAWMALIAVAALASATMAQQKADPKAEASPPKADKPAVVIVDVSQLKAKVDAVDPAKRLVTVTGPRGNTVTMKVGPEVKNLDQVKPGDELVVRYYDSVALFVRKSTEPPAAAAVGAVAVAPKGAKPGGVMVESTEMTAQVEAIDYAKRTVTLKGPEGKTRMLKVDRGVKRFKEIKKGDEVVVRLTEAIAISVKTP